MLLETSLKQQKTILIREPPYFYKSKNEFISTTNFVVI